MISDLIVCCSLTYAQRTSVVLEREGIPGSIQRTPAQLSEKGCSYAVKIPHKRLMDAIQTINRAGLIPTGIYTASGNGSYRDVLL